MLALSDGRGCKDRLGPVPTGPVAVQPNFGFRMNRNRCHSKIGRTATAGPVATGCSPVRSRFFSGPWDWTFEHYWEHTYPSAFVSHSELEPWAGGASRPPSRASSVAGSKAPSAAGSKALSAAGSRASSRTRD
ncbi:hypothetical protein EDB85DRAFT_1890450 [Lactarius pseudohatsudake]|nr:hypothetical protein EDB85DRAFT_1890450 [Lactarius pseudohatsudake]